MEAAAQKVAAEEAADAAKAAAAAASATVDATATVAEQEAVAAVAAEMREAEQRAQREELRDVATSIEEKVEECKYLLQPTLCTPFSACSTHKTARIIHNIHIELSILRKYLKKKSFLFLEM